MAASDYSVLCCHVSEGSYDLVHSCHSRNFVDARIQRFHCRRTGASAVDFSIDPHGLEIAFRTASYLVTGFLLAVVSETRIAENGSVVEIHVQHRRF